MGASSVFAEQQAAITPSTPSQISSPAEIAITDRSRFISIIRFHAKKNAMPTELAEAVAYIESGYNPEKIGGVGEIGLMQVRPETAAMLGFQGTTEELAAPETNIRYGVTYLAQAWRLAEGDLCRTLMKYRAGHGEEHMTPRSVEYCSRAKMYLARTKSALAANFTAQDLIMHDFKALSATADRFKRLKLASFPKKFHTSEEFWAAHDAHIQLLTQRVHDKWERRQGQKISAER